MAGNRIQIHIDSRDDILRSFGNQLAAVGEGKARVAMARAVNYGGRKTAVGVRRALAKQTSAPLALIKKTVLTKGAAHQGNDAIEFVIYARGSELPLKLFKPKQFGYGVRAKVWGKMQRFEHMFGAPGDNPKVISALKGNIFHRTDKSRLPIEQGYGPSLPKEMVIGETAKVFQKMAYEETAKRLRHELSRMLTG